MAVRSPLEDRTVAQVMTTDLLTITPDDSVLMAWELMCQAHVHHLPVVNDKGHFMGVIDARGLATTWEASGPGRARRPVREILPGTPILAVRPDDPVPAAARAMLSAATDYVGVMDEREALIGLLTAHDLIHALAGGPPREPRPRPGMPSLYRIEPVLPRPVHEPEPGPGPGTMPHPSRSRMSPD
ncbi:CBS domain-containing protein [Spirillospora sp. NPDC047279]|uniref:CBS domain-containing protein n=1 Tax=Spirillospora sp. NPDC047279 TaxID=3155478 RepID=UPI0033DA8359